MSDENRCPAHAKGDVIDRVLGVDRDSQCILPVGHEEAHVLATAQSFKSRVSKLLRAVEEAGCGCVSKDASTCPSCQELMGCEGDKHAPDCELAALLRECEA